MTKKGFRNVTLKDGTHARLTEVSNILRLSRPDTVNSLVESFLLKHQEQEELKELTESATS